MCHIGGPNDDDVQMDIVFDDLEETLNQYSIGGYVIAYETEPYKHFHFLVEMTEQDYTRFRKRVFIDKYGLRGQAKAGKPRQYGKVNNIDDFDKMLSYTVKDSNIRSNLSDELLNDAIDKSFKKQQPKLLKDKMTKYVDDYLEQHTALGNSKKKKDVYNENHYPMVNPRKDTYS